MKVREFGKWVKGILILGVLLSLGAVSCSRRANNPEGAMTTAPVSSADQPGQQTKKGGEYSFGIPNCDAFVKKFEICVMAVTNQENREQLRVDFEKTIEDLGKAREGQTPYSLEEACQKNEAKARSLVGESCQW